MEKNKPVTNISDNIIGLGMSTAVTGFIMAEVLRKMDGLFGNTEKIPKGVVKEMMEGVMEGLFNMFETRLYDKEEQLRVANDKIRNLEEEIEMAKLTSETYTKKPKTKN